MQSYNNCLQCPYDAPSCFSCPDVQNAYYSQQPQENDFFRMSEDFEVVEDIFDEPVYEGGECIEEDQSRAPQDIGRVIRLINQQAFQAINEITRIGMDRRLLDYIIKSMVTYIDRNYNKYRGSKDRKVQAALNDLRRDLPWVFDIMRIYSVSPATQGRLIDDIVRISLESLRVTQPSPPPATIPRKK